MSQFEVHKIKFEDYGGAPFVHHDMPCAVCATRHAVFNLHTGVFQPCWQCFMDGWLLRKHVPFRVRVKRAILGGK